MHMIKWTIGIEQLPQIIKTCPRCHCGRYENSGCFRVNANGPRLDVWLVFRCSACKSTWNMRVYERIDRADLDKTLYSALMQNDERLVRRIAFDRTLLVNNHVSIDYSTIALHITGDDIPQGEAAFVTLSSEYDLTMPVCGIIAKKLDVSKSRLKKLEDAGLLAVDGGVKKRKVGLGFRFTLKEGWSLE